MAELPIRDMNGLRINTQKRLINWVYPTEDKPTGRPFSSAYDTSACKLSFDIWRINTNLSDSFGKEVSYFTGTDI
ncbi:hypothetical protein [Halalkalicoccus subterraneus]|uniref:hypothetical protein n=1 Tax=Halalkalicoccus subterraneus TaxID=2675002 RepID=UPI0013CEC5C7